ncbi:hypothetical protein JXA48_03090 [Candidatus Woesearchaeota archaeon]|nr:hypothetical protein [Candidatus Woesearchaeota archaeon]
MKLIPRGLFKERKKNSELNKDYFPVEIRKKILMLFNDFDLNQLDTSSVAVITGTYSNDTLDLMKSKLKYLIDSKHLNNFENYFIYCELNELFSCIELYVDCMSERIQRYEQHVTGSFSSRRYDTSNILVEFIKAFNNLLDYHKIPYQFSYNKILDRLYIENKLNEQEEQTKEQFFDLIKDKKTNEYFTNSIINFTQKDFKGSIENSYLTLERFLKIKTGNMDKSAVDNYADFQKNNFKGIFTLPEFKGKIKSQIACVYGLRSKLKSHSPNEKFDDSEFLRETARFQMNEVMTICLLLNEVSK